jgi:DNA-binding NarL/FixJ family response regulator
MRVLIADDHAIVRRGLRDILAHAYAGTHFAEASTGDEVIQHLGESHFDVLLLDISMPGRSGLDILREVKHLHPRLPVVMLSILPEDQYALRCLRAGAAAYLNKDSAPEELLQTIRKVLRGGRYVSASVADKLVDDLSDPPNRPLHELLSDREHEVMKMIAAGVALTEIALQLHLSVKTISSYRTRILEKMRMKSNAELTRYALEHKLIE